MRKDCGTGDLEGEKTTSNILEIELKRHSDLVDWGMGEKESRTEGAHSFFFQQTFECRLCIWHSSPTS